MEGQKIQAEGRLERAGGAKYEYGTHALYPPGSRRIQYILKSGSVHQLKEFEGRDVQVTGSLVEDASLDAGDPKLLNVLAARPLFEGSDGTLR